MRRRGQEVFSFADGATSVLIFRGIEQGVQIKRISNYTAEITDFWTDANYERWFMLVGKVNGGRYFSHEMREAHFYGPPQRLKVALLQATGCQGVVYHRCLALMRRAILQRSPVVQGLQLAHFEEI